MMYTTSKRALIKGMISLPLLNACSSTIPRQYDAIIDANSPNSLATALAQVPKRPAGSPWRILLKKGRYIEKLFIDVPDLHLYGEGEDTVISFGAYSGMQNPSTGKPYTTQGCATLIVRAKGFEARHLRIENNYDYLANDALANDDPRRSNDPQGVALMLTKGSDRAYFEDVTLYGHQDTLYTDIGRSHFVNCRISGGVDFIFGAGNALFDSCDLISRPRSKPNVHPLGYITAASTNINQFYGLTFIRCRLLPESAQVGPNSVSLGRPWHPAATFPDGRYADPDAIAKVVYIDCEMGPHIIKEAPWWWMAGLQKTGPERTVFSAESARFFEYQSHGPGAALTAKRPQLTVKDSTLYTPKLILAST